MLALLKPLSLAAFALAVTLGAVEAQETVDAGKPEALLTLIQGFGTATLEADETGDPVILGMLGDKPIVLFFRGCEVNTNCKFVSFYARWEQANVPADQLQTWNAQSYFSRAYFETPGVEVLTLDVNLFGGVTPANFTDTIDWFKTTVEGFQDQVIDAAAGN